jgi:hypothetical protein
MAIQKKSLAGTTISSRKEVDGSSSRKPGDKPAQPERTDAAKKLAVAKLATAKLSTAKLTTLRRLN